MSEKSRKSPVRDELSAYSDIEEHKCVSQPPANFSQIFYFI